MDSEIGAALPAGFVGTLVMTMLMSMGKSMGMTTMDIVLICGGMMSGDERRGPACRDVHPLHHHGNLGLRVSLRTVVPALDSASWSIGLVSGLVHGEVTNWSLGANPAYLIEKELR